MDFSDYSQIYQEVKAKCDLPDWCGENQDALWDAVTGMMETPARIHIKAWPRGPEWVREVQAIRKIFRRAQQAYGLIKLEI